MPDVRDGFPRPWICNIKAGNLHSKDTLTKEHRKRPALYSFSCLLAFGYILRLEGLSKNKIVKKYIDKNGAAKVWSTRYIVCILLPSVRYRFTPDSRYGRLETAVMGQIVCELRFVRSRSAFQLLHRV